VAKLYGTAPVETSGFLPISSALLGIIALITGGLWLQTEWQAGALAGHLLQAYLGLGLIAWAIGGGVVLGPHLLQTAIIAGAIVLWERRIRDALGSSDMSKWADGYRNQPYFWKLHLLISLMAIPWPGTPSGEVWLLALGRDLWIGSGLGLLTVVGVLLVAVGMLRSLRKVASRITEESFATSPETTGVSGT
jgi:hypothetical protein